MTMTMDADRQDKTAEFARLFDLFDRLKRGGRAVACSSAEGDPEHDVYVPEDLAPIIHKLVPGIGEAPSPATLRGRPAPPSRRRHTLAPSSAPPPQFPLAGDAAYKFTFNMMLHKIYDLEQWADKVRAVLADSQSAYRPLSELEEIKRGARRRVASIATESATPRDRVLTIGVKQAAEDAEWATRALKKRCVGRRKSTSGQPPSSWVYDVAVSAVGKETPRITVEAAPATASLNTQQRPVAGSPRHRRASIGRMESGAQVLPVGTGLGAKRRATITTHLDVPKISGVKRPYAAF